MTTIDLLVGGTQEGDVEVAAADVDFVIGCGRCKTDIHTCSCPKDWLGNRELWIAAERKLEQLRAEITSANTMLETARGHADELMQAVTRDGEKAAKMIHTLQKALGEALRAWTRNFGSELLVLQQTLDESLKQYPALNDMPGEYP